MVTNPSLMQLVSRVVEFDKESGPCVRAYLDQLDAKISEACLDYDVSYTEEAAQFALIILGLVPPSKRTISEIELAICLTRHLTAH